MLEVRRKMDGTPNSRSPSRRFEVEDEIKPRLRTFKQVVDAARSPKKLHEALEKRRGGHDRMKRYRVQEACDEEGKTFVSIEVLPHFL